MTLCKELLQVAIKVPAEHRRKWEFNYFPWTCLLNAAVKHTKLLQYFKKKKKTHKYSTPTTFSRLFVNKLLSWLQEWIPQTWIQRLGLELHAPEDSGMSSPSTAFQITHSSPRDQRVWKHQGSKLQEHLASPPRHQDTFPKHRFDSQLQFSFWLKFFG